MDGSGPAGSLERTQPGAGRTAGGFRLLDILGRGGMGVVFRGVDAEGREAAVKFLLQLGEDGEEAVRRFDREGRVRIDHPNICRVLASGTDEAGMPFIAFELLRGEALHTRIARGTLSPREAAGVGVQVCHGLAAAHAVGIVHRDLKPSNLFLCADGTVKLVDFGIALLTDPAATRLTASGAVVGTPAYLSPEQARGIGGVDARTDVWSLAVSLYEALSGRLPFERETALATMVAILMDAPVPLRCAAPGVPPGLAEAVERGLCKEPGERWQGAAEFGAALAGLDLAAGDEHPPAPAPRVTAFPEEQRVVAVLLAEDVRDATAIERAVRERGGEYLPLLGRRALGVFGGAAWEGDELLQAGAAAIAVRHAAGRMAIASGRAALTGAGISGVVLRAAEQGCAANLPGVAVERDLARSLRTGLSVRDVADGLSELVGVVPQTLTLGGDAQDTLWGREPELSQLRSAIEEVLDRRHALALLLSGPAGIGKSRLAREAERMAEQAAPPLWVLSGRAEPLHRHRLFDLFRSILENRAARGVLQLGWPRLDARNSADERRRAVELLAAEVAPHGSPPPWTGVLGELLGLPAPERGDDATAPRDPQFLADRYRIALLDHLGAYLEAGPTMLAVEDLQWADPASLELLDQLLDRFAAEPLLIVATTRPELQEGGGRVFEGRNLVHVKLGGLAPEDVGRLATEAAGRHLTTTAVAAVAERTQGNPLFVREIAMQLGPAGWRVDAAGGLPLPVTVEAAIQSRLDHLSTAEKDLCKRAAVLGRAFLPQELAALGVADVDALLGALRHKDVVVSRQRPPGGVREYAFRSGLVADVAYRMLTPELREELHRLAAGHLGTAEDAQAEEVASHLERGARPEQAVRWYLMAALEAVGRGDSRRVVDCAEHAQRGGSEVPYPLHIAHAEALGFLGRRDDEALALARALATAPDDAERARVLTRQAEWLRRTGRLPEALGAAAQAVSAARRAGDLERLTWARAWQVGALAAAGRAAEAREALGEAIRSATGTSAKTRGFVADQRAVLAAAAGDLAEMREAFREAVRLYQSSGDIRRELGARTNLADAFNRVGAYDEAAAALRDALESCRRLGSRMREAYALCNLGYSLVMLGSWEEAMRTLDAAAGVAGRSGDARLSVAVRVYRSRALLLAGRPHEAADQAEAAARDAERLGLPDWQVNAWTLAARALLAARDPRAVSLSTAALELRDRLGTVAEDEAETFLVHALALRAAGREAEAREAGRRGRERVLELAARIGDAAWRDRYLRGIPAHRALLEIA
ncbi:MAG: AAA family ATPase [Deltaproteobacteria bacterium]|nr:AAA family ATPase [Deltaproteobacteria bacterium]